MFVYIKQDKNGDIKFSKEELDKLLNEAYNNGYRDGQRFVYPYYNYYQYPIIPTITTDTITIDV